MKYIAIITEVKKKSFTLFPTDVKAAIRLARLSNPSFECEQVTELFEGDKPGESYYCHGSCCNYEEPIISGEGFTKGNPEEGTEDICHKCSESLNK